jgi:hypothetical protein
VVKITISRQVDYEWRKQESVQIQSLVPDAPPHLRRFCAGLLNQNPTGYGCRERFDETFTAFFFNAFILRKSRSEIPTFRMGRPLPSGVTPISHRLKLRIISAGGKRGSAMRGNGFW